MKDLNYFEDAFFQSAFVEISLQILGLHFPMFLFKIRRSRAND